MEHIYSERKVLKPDFLSLIGPTPLILPYFTLCWYIIIMMPCHHNNYCQKLKVYPKMYHTISFSFWLSPITECTIITTHVYTTTYRVPFCLENKGEVSISEKKRCVRHNLSHLEFGTHICHGCHSNIPISLDNHRNIEYKVWLTSVI